MGNGHVTGQQGVGPQAWANGQMDQEASVWLVIYLGLDQEDEQKEKKKKRKRRELCVASCVALKDAWVWEP